MPKHEGKPKAWTLNNLIKDTATVLGCGSNEVIEALETKVYKVSKTLEKLDEYAAKENLTKEETQEMLDLL